jgi:hypothetical protein
MHHFEGCGGAQGLLVRHVEQPRALDQEKRAQAFAAAKRGVAHGLHDAPFGPAGRREEGIELCLNRRRRKGQRLF